MKKAKIILTAIAALTITGGVVAFKANTSRVALKYCYTTVQGALCTSIIANGKTTAAPAGTTAFYRTTPLGAACPQSNCVNFSRITAE